MRLVRVTVAIVLKMGYALWVIGFPRPGWIGIGIYTLVGIVVNHVTRIRRAWHVAQIQCQNWERTPESVHQARDGMVTNA